MIPNNLQYPKLSDLIDSYQTEFISNIYPAILGDFETKYGEFTFSYQIIDSGGSRQAVVNVYGYGIPRVFLDGNLMLDGSKLLKS